MPKVMAFIILFCSNEHQALDNFPIAYCLTYTVESFFN